MLDNVLWAAASGIMHVACILQTGKLVRSTPPPSSQPQQQATSPQQSQSQQPQSQPQQQPVPQIPQQQQQQQAPPPARAGGATYLHPPPFQPSSGVVTPVVSLNQPPPVSHVHGAGYAPVPPQQQPPLPQREPNKISVMDSKRPLQQIRPGKLKGVSVLLTHNSL